MAATAINRVGYGQVEPNKLIGIKTGDIHNMLPLDESVKVLQNGEFMFYDYVTNSVTATPTAMTVPYMVWNEIKIYEDWLALKDFAMIRVGENYVTNNPAVGRVTSVNVDGTIYGDGALTTSTELTYDEDGNPTGEVRVDRQHTDYGYRMNGIVPRMLGTYVGDVMTTNMVGMFEDDEKNKTELKYEQGTILALRKTVRNTLELVPYDFAKTKNAALAETLKYVIVQDYTMPDGQRGFKLQRIA